MELFPQLIPGWFNGWLPLAGFYTVFIALMVAFPRDVIKRLYSRPPMTRNRFIVSRIGVLINLVNLILMILTPLKIGQGVFVLGGILYIVGFAGMVVALINYKNAPPDQPATAGLYRLSRNPQWVMLFILILGIAVAIGSWLAVILLALVSAIYHLRILAEEQACLSQYSDSYRAFMRQVPRYFIAF